MTDSQELVATLRQLALPDANVDPQSVYLRSTAIFAQLKAHNRAANATKAIARQKADQSRQKMDQSHLGLQNVLYEKRHLEREIQKCRQFASVYQDVPLHSMEDFVVLAPEEARTKEVLADEHALMVTRLSFEIAERMRLENRRKELAKEKEELLHLSKKNVSTMDNVKTQIDHLMKSAVEIQAEVDKLVQTLPPLPPPEPSA
ncbi:Fms-interacting protein-domain-containing protein [Flagelloscypha sp. PMI_526]|nr:Fms-interacting protein-domain-containing protein [Flagelloscypha sp. PMI_526]